MLFIKLFFILVFFTPTIMTYEYETPQYHITEEAEEGSGGLEDTGEEEVA